MRTWGHEKGQERGASLVEFAFLAPILVLLIFGVIEFGRLGFAFTEIWTAAREGARYATTVGDENGDTVPNFVDCEGISNAAHGRLALSSLDTVEITYTPPTGPPSNCQSGTPPSEAGNISTGTKIEVTARASFDAVVPILRVFLDDVELDSSQVRTVNYGVLDDSP